MKSVITKTHSGLTFSDLISSKWRLCMMQMYCIYLCFKLCLEYNNLAYRMYFSRLSLVLLSFVFQTTLVVECIKVSNVTFVISDLKHSQEKTQKMILYSYTFSHRLVIYQVLLIFQNPAHRHQVNYTVGLIL